MEEEMPELVLLSHDYTSVSSNESKTASIGTYCDLDNLVDNVVNYTSNLKNHNMLVQLIKDSCVSGHSWCMNTRW